jgi:BirA family biotin operon repressor/biotin-[acetyl-CoA-carboxylase] ligase
MDWTRSAALVPELIVRESSPSTNAELAARVRAGSVPGYTTLVTLDQTAGRGRLDRTWVAPAGSALAISVVLVPDLPLERFGWFTIAAGVAMTETVLGMLPTASVGLKWPNDVLVGDKKICGVLSELVPEAGALVIGAGVNTAMNAEQLPVPTATSLAIEGAETPDPDAVLAGYLQRLRELADAYVASAGDADVSGLRARARALCTTLGREVRVELPNGDLLVGTATDLDADGRLIVRLDGDAGSVTVAAGDVTHLRYG